MIVALGIFVLLAFLADWWWNRRNPALPTLPTLPTLPNPPMMPPTQIDLLERIATALETIAQQEKDSQGMLLKSLEKACASTPKNVSKAFLYYGFT